MPLNSFPPTVHRPRLRGQAGRRAGHGAHRLRALGRARARQPRAHGGAGRVRRRRLQGLHGRQRQRRLRRLRRPHAVRGHVPRRRARPARGGARRERRGGARARAAARSRRARRRWPTTPPPARSPPRSRRSRARSRWPARRAARCTSCTSPAAAPRRSWPRPARRARMSPARPARTISTLTAEDAERIGVLAKCAPPLRSADERDGLWRAVRLGTIDFIASDHSPAPPAMKQGHAFAAWGGISGCQTTARHAARRGPHDHGAGAPVRGGAGDALRPAGRPRRAGASADLLLIDPHPSSRAQGARALLPPPAEPVRRPQAARAHRAHAAARPHGRDRRPSGRRAAGAARATRVEAAV